MGHERKRFVCLRTVRTDRKHERPKFLPGAEMVTVRETLARPSTLNRKSSARTASQRLFRTYEDELVGLISRCVYAFDLNDKQFWLFLYH
jgi:hypothetical protein